LGLLHLFWWQCLKTGENSGFAFLYCICPGVLPEPADGYKLAVEASVMTFESDFSQMHQSAYFFFLSS
jgi:hypothetical protein